MSGGWAHRGGAADQLRAVSVDGQRMHTDTAVAFTTPLIPLRAECRHRPARRYRVPRERDRLEGRGAGLLLRLLGVDGQQHRPCQDQACRQHASTQLTVHGAVGCVRGGRLLPQPVGWISPWKQRRPAGLRRRPERGGSPGAASGRMGHRSVGRRCARWSAWVRLVRVSSRRHLSPGVRVSGLRRRRHSPTNSQPGEGRTSWDRATVRGWMRARGRERAQRAIAIALPQAQDRD